MSLFTDDLIWSIENRAEPVRKKFTANKKFSKVAVYKINIQKLIAFLYSNHKLIKKFLKISFIIATKIRYLTINFTKEVKELYIKNSKTLWKEIGDSTNKWEDISYSWN